MKAEVGTGGARSGHDVVVTSSRHPADRGPVSRASPWLLAALLGGAGVLHLVVPGPYVRIVPDVLPQPELLVAASGVAEIACGALVAWPRTRRLGGWASAALFVAVLPANVQMALDSRAWSPLAQAAAWGRLPLQVPLVWWAVLVARRAGGGPAAR